MLFDYIYINEEGNEKSGVIDAVSKDSAIDILQKKGLTLSSIRQSNTGSFWNMNIKSLERVSQREIVMLSRQISTLFEAQVSALKVFNILA